MNSTNKLYYHRTGLPDLVYPQQTFNLIYSRHALERAEQRNKFGINLARHLPKSLDTTKAQVIEVETKKELFDEKIYKILYRIHFNNKYDLVMAVVVDEGDDATVKSVWLNDKRDYHESLYVARYTPVKGREVFYI
jgi:hypothetical protein